MWLDQSFALVDLPKLFFLAFLEIGLSLDNALVLGLLASKLEKKLQKQALFVGYISSLFIRLIAIITLSFFLQYPWIQTIGAIYLLYLAFRFFLSRKKLLELKGRSGFWKTVLAIEAFDLLFAIDSIVAALAFIREGSSHIPTSKLWIVYFGGMMGVLGVRFASHAFSRAMHRFPSMKKGAHLMIGWIGLDLLFPSLNPALFWSVLMLFFLYGFYLPRRCR